MRDADLWDDFGAWVRKNCGRVGSMVILAAQLAEGDSDELGEYFFKKRYTKAQLSAKFQPPTKIEEARVKRELTESESRRCEHVLLLIASYRASVDCVVSELLSTACLLVLFTLHIILEALGVEGHPSFYDGGDKTHEWRVNGIHNYLASDLQSAF
jgi:hypothetical protein